MKNPTKGNYQTPSVYVLALGNDDVVRTSNVLVNYTGAGNNNGWGAGSFDNPLDENN